ncbi:MAG: HAMP domain-containing histidine kinase [Oscillospiraceae bacterium]|nr:HAMP domain-containing histidine kinase [Oscillospiraceae bacterium]
MQTAFSISLIIFVVFILLANPGEKFNRWCCLAMIFFFLGIFKQAIMFEIIPMLHNVLEISGLDEKFGPLHNFFTWVIYALGMPTMAIAGFYFGYIDVDKKSKLIKYAMYVPAAVLLIFFSPFKFIEYQKSNLQFWFAYTAYNLVFCIIIAVFSFRGIQTDKKELENGSILKKKKNQRMREAAILLPTLYIWYLSVFPVNLFSVMGLRFFGGLLQIWQFNIITVLVCVIGAIFMAVNGGGFLGIKILPMRYDKNLISNDEFMSNFSHRIKSDTSYMAVSVDKIKEALNEGGGDHGEISEKIQSNIEELSNDIATLNNLSRKYNQYSNVIYLEKKAHRLLDLLNEANNRNTAQICVNIENINEGLFLECDKSLMLEVFKDIIENGIQSIQAKGSCEKTEDKIVVLGSCEKNKYKIRFIDEGTGISPNKLESIFEMGVTTKNKEFNSGLGLANCKKIIEKHGGIIYAENNKNGSGATITIEFPARAIAFDK